MLQKNLKEQLRVFGKTREFGALTAALKKSRNGKDAMKPDVI